MQIFPLIPVFRGIRIKVCILLNRVNLDRDKKGKLRVNGALVLT